MDYPALDPIDREILAVLGSEGRISWQDLGRRIRLSATATAERVRRLERDGIIAGYRAVLDQAALGRPLEVFVDVKLRPDHRAELFAPDALQHPAVIEVCHVTGRFDCLVRARCRDTSELNELLHSFKVTGGATETETRLVLTRAAET